MAWLRPERLKVGWISLEDGKYLVEPLYKKSSDKGRIVMTDKVTSLVFDDKVRLEGNVFVILRGKGTSFVLKDENWYWNLKGPIKNERKGYMFWNLLRVFQRKGIKEVKTNDLRLDFKDKYEVKELKYFVINRESNRGILEWA